MRREKVMLLLYPEVISFYCRLSYICHYILVGGMLTHHFQSLVCKYERFLRDLIMPGQTAKVSTHLPTRVPKDEELKPKSSGSRKPKLVAWGS